MLKGKICGEWSETHQHLVDFYYDGQSTAYIRQISMTGANWRSVISLETPPYFTETLHQTKEEAMNYVELYFLCKD